MKIGIRRETEQESDKECERETADEKLKSEVSLLEFGCNPLPGTSLALLRFSESSVRARVGVCEATGLCIASV